jgi:hypothetical protein
MYEIENRSFIDLCLQGRATLAQIDDYIEKWHRSAEDIDIVAYLGMTAKEYDLFVRNPDSLASILKAHREGQERQ